MKNVFVLGSINTDFVISTNRLPEAGETLKGFNFFHAHGGKGSNQAVASARLGGNTLMCGVVGNDLFGKKAIESMKNDGIDVTYIRVIDGVSSGVAVITLFENNNRIILDEGANKYLSKEYVDSFLENANKGDIFLTQLENPIEIIGYSLIKAKEKGLFVILNPAPANNEVKEYLKYCDLIIPNETELELLGGEQELLKLVKMVITTLGDKGVKITTKENSRTYPCEKVKVVDTTAAGDTFCGGLVAYLSKGHTLEESVIFGSKMATIACMKQGAQSSIPYLK